MSIKPGAKWLHPPSLTGTKEIKNHKTREISTVLFYNPYNIWPLHLEAELEIIDIHRQLGHRIIVLTCNGEINPCDQLLEGSHSCLECCRRRDYGYKRTGLRKSIKFKTAICLTKEEIVEAQIFIENSSYQTLAGLKSIRYEDFDLGMAVAASLISHLREPYPCTGRHKELIKNLLFSTLHTYLSLKNHLAQERVSIAYVFNGRLSVLRAAYRACKHLDVPVICHERAGVMNKYSLVENTTIHDLGWWKDNIELSWNTALLPEEEKIRTGEKWFIDRLNGVNQGWFSFSKDFLPASSLTNANRKNQLHCAIFISSEDEMETIESWQIGKIYKNQFCALDHIFKELAAGSEFQFTLRVHPNLKNIQNSQTKSIGILKQKYPEIDIIDASNTASSYDIIRSSDLILVFGSTIGIEAAYLGKTVILVGHAFYESLNACLNIESRDHLIELFKKYAEGPDTLIRSTSQAQALKFGFFMEVYGTDFRLLQQQSPFVFEYRGKLFEPREKPSLIQRISQKNKAILLKIFGTLGKLMSR